MCLVVEEKVVSILIMVSKSINSVGIIIMVYDMLITIQIIIIHCNRDGSWIYRTVD